jgi:hypothetical protein
MPLARIGEWRGRAIEVTAHLIPRYLWTTASIDVYIDSECVLRTGGKLAATGGVRSEFYDSGATHEIALNWGRPQLQSFPIEITIDGKLIVRSQANVDNWPLALWPAALVVAGIAWAFWRATHGGFAM